jgi:subfamily B ATP-binding cassette protein MsbA
LRRTRRRALAISKIHLRNPALVARGTGLITSQIVANPVPPAKPKPQRLSRTRLAKMSGREVWQASKEPYRKLLSYLTPYRGRFVMGILCGALFAATNSALIFATKHVGDLVFGGSNVKANIFSTMAARTDAAASTVAGQPSITAILLACISIPLIMLLRGLFSYLNAYYLLWVSLRVLDDIRVQLFGRLLAQSMEFYNKAKTGELIQVVFNQTRMAQQALATISSDLIKQPISIIGALATLCWIDWKFTLVALVLFPVCIVPVMIVGRKVRKAGAREEEEAGQIMVVMQEAFAGIRVVKANAREDYELGRFTDANRKMLRLIMRWRKAMELVGPLVETFASFGIGLALLYVWHFKLSAGTFIALQGGLVLLYPPFKALSRIHIMLQKCLAATAKVFELMELDPAIQDRPDAHVLGRATGAIQFEGVSFSYHSGGAPALREVSFAVPPGRTYALVGASGAGKTTVLSLLLRFYEPDHGRILLDGRDLRELALASVRENIAVVSQDVFLFHDTIANNIRYGRLDATREEVEEAARRAFAHEFILEQPQGYDTIVGDKGSRLSGGQQQRISIARAILRDAPILLLDEAMSALDSESERKIQQAIETLAQGRTVIAIAHRLSTILGADQILVMDHGRVMDSGTHAELLERCTHYRRLYELQFHHASGE